ncbi:MAG: YdcF family protein [Corynebacterium sp.]|uniref:YdcF family protein n=1 Tax=Corynebacterium sp. TaxID=1720 RepID=UPI0026DFC9A9|nr:YdcF family protein [Corynebacterium sp.]MDO5669160.1 YdcF family protein [Corynebacterium sp.]
MHVRQRKRLYRRSRPVTVALLVLLVVAVGFLASMVWFLLPPTKQASSSDAVVVLGGASDGRHELGAEFIDDGLADSFVVAVPRGSADRVGWAYCHGEHTGEADTWCLDPRPSTTAGEALGVEKLAAEQSWDSVTVVTSRPHTRRTQMVFDRCTDLDVTVAHIDNVRWRYVPRDMARETLGALKFWVRDPCQV